VEYPISIKTIKKTKLESPEDFYCITINKPHEILIKPKFSLIPYSIIQCNFGLIFGMSFKKFSVSVLETAWSEERINEFVKEKKLENTVKWMQDHYPNVEKKIWSYYAVSKFIRDQFFDTYKGLMKRIKRNEQLGKDLGYIRSYHGGIRRVPLLSLSTDENGKWRSGEDIREMANLVNITSNSTIQTDEICVVALAMLEWYKQINPEHSRMIGSIHDSVDGYIEKEQALKTFDKIKEIFERSEEWQKGIKFLIDFVIVDFENPEHYYKKGYDLSQYKELQNDI
jgi:hypothetical protein